MIYIILYALWNKFIKAKKMWCQEWRYRKLRSIQNKNCRGKRSVKGEISQMSVDRWREGKTESESEEVLVKEKAIKTKEKLSCVIATCIRLKKRIERWQ